MATLSKVRCRTEYLCWRAFFLRLTVALLVSSLFGGPAFAAKLATLDKVQGDVRVFQETKEKGRKGLDGKALFPGQTIRTLDDKSSADIVFANGDRVRVMPNSEMTLAAADIGDEKSTIGIDLAAGKIFNVVNKLSKGSSYKVKTGTAIAGVKGTIFSAEVVQNRSIFMVKEGTVEAYNPGKPQEVVQVAELKKTEVAGNEAPSAPVDMSPEEIAMFEVLEDITASIKDEIREDIQQRIREEAIDRGGVPDRP